MPDAESSVSRKPRTRFRRIRRGCLVLILIIAAGTGVLWFFSDRNPAASAWHRLPAGTRWAIEAYRPGDLARRALENPALAELLETAERIFPESGMREARFAPGMIGFVRRAGGIVRHLPFLWPASMVLGETGLPDAAIQPPVFFLVVRSPLAHLAWRVFGQGDRAASLFPEPGEEWFFAAADGWLIISTSRTVAETFVSGDGFSPSPLGQAPGRDGACLTLAWLGETETSAVRSEAFPPDGPPLFNPLAPGIGAMDPEPVVPVEPSRPIRHRLSLSPTGSGWEIEGGFRFPSPVEETIPVLSPPPGKDVFISAGIARSRLDAWGKILNGERTKSNRPETNPIAYLADLWLARADGDFRLSVAAPVAPEAAGIPPFPVLGFGWRWREEISAEQASLAFEAALKNLFSNLADAEAPYPVSLLRGAMAYERRIEGKTLRGGADLPPIAANSTRPSWRLPLAGESAAWLASDPAGLPDKEADAFGGDGLSGHGEDTIVLAAVWRISPALKAGLIGVCRDRLETLPDRMFPWRKPILEWFDLAGPLLDNVSRGRLLLRDEGETDGIILKMALENPE